MKPILISGIQPTGRLHLGNYLGALKNFVDLQSSEKYECYFFIADYHSLTEDFDPKEKPKQILSLAADFIAAGLDPKKSVLFIQSQIPAHTELQWLFSAITPENELRRMTQYKDKVVAGGQSANVGLLIYPVLMAVDILIYDPKFVPVGEDQLQHLELTRTLARKFNSKFGKIFTEPKAVMTSTPRVMSLDNPQKKMSKSSPAGCLFIDDEPETIKEKIKKAVTDSGSEIKYDEKNKPAISNLLSIYSALSGQSILQLEKKFAGKNYSYFKNDLAELTSDYFRPFRERKKELLKNPAAIKKTFAAGAKKARIRAQKKIKEVKEKVGLI
ncbi:MAG: tryptophan--tRNA ligase [Parcubacteria group bacterium]|nr:tryptophan--tRNA ligase [Parcubacteria group bacterium]